MLRHARELSPRNSLITFWETSVAGAFSPGNSCVKRFCRTAPTALASLQPATEARVVMVSPLPQAASGRAVRRLSMRSWILRARHGGAQHHGKEQPETCSAHSSLLE